MPEGDIQLRSELNGLRYVKTLKEALSLAKQDKSIWKISFSLGEERVRLIRDSVDGWVLTNILEG
jgi:hypothetical protein